MNKKFIVLSLILIFVFVFITFASSSDRKQEKVYLREPLPLKLRYKIGETLYYRLVRQNILFKMDGSKFGELKAVAYFIRTRVEDDSQGRVREKFTWKNFGFGQSFTPDQPVKISYLKEAEDFSLTMSVQDHDLLFKLDFSKLPRTIEGLWFMIMVWDAITFDGAVRPQKHFPFPDSALIGTETHDTHGPWEFPFDYQPIVTDSKYFFSGKYYSKVSGVSLEKNIPCAVVEFAALKNRVLMNLHLAPVRLRTQGFEHFWGKTYLSLEDGRIVGGELVGPVTQVQDLWMSGQKEPDHSEFFTLQNLELEMLSVDEFNSEVKKQKETLKD